MRNPRHIFITGASSGIGAALALLYAEPGVTLSLHGRDQDRLTALAKEATRAGANVIALSCDITNAAAMASMITERDRAQPIDLMIANAGISAGGSDSKERTVLETNVMGVLNSVQPLLPLMQRRSRGQIAIMSSLASFRGFAGSGAYCASKAAVRLYGEALRSEYRAKGVEVNVICPGFIKTHMTDVNRFPMPFLMSAQEAAVLIRKGLEHNQARIAFPWPMYVLVRILAGLPQGLLEAIQSFFPRKHP